MLPISCPMLTFRRAIYRTPSSCPHLGSLGASPIFHARLCASFKSHRPALYGACNKRQPSLMPKRSPDRALSQCFREDGKKPKCARRAVLGGAALLGAQRNTLGWILVQMCMPIENPLSNAFPPRDKQMYKAAHKGVHNVHMYEIRSAKN
jgi:hypothetical protein